MGGTGSTITWCCLFLSILSSGYSEKYRICIVDGKGHFKRSAKYCPELDKPDSKVECVLALDRLDCLRRIWKGTVDFSVFTPEDLVTATNAGVEVLITNQLRLTQNQHDYEVVAVTDNKSGIKSRHTLTGSKYCHPGYGYEQDWNRILANYFEASVVIQSCDPQLSITENRIKASSEFFDKACKAGPWVNNHNLEETLKNKYPNLCSLCDDTYRCSIQDKYWGRRGSLLCLTDGAGDVSWARLDDVKAHFGIIPGIREASSEGYSLLCPDDTIMPVNSTNPCVWVVRPWSVIAARRTKAQEIQEIISTLNHQDQTPWRSNLLNLIEPSYTTFVNVDPIEPIESYLDKATGFLSANSFSGCHPPRTIRICTTSILENAKCSWLRESATVYGIEPDLDCIKADNLTQCMRAVQNKAADVVMVPSDKVHHAKSNYNLATLFYETVDDNEKYLTVAVTRPGFDISSFEELEGKKACFPVYDGVAWNTIVKTVVKKCPSDKAMASFFGPSCTPSLPDGKPNTLKQICQDDFSGEFGALHCLTTGVGDVAFVSYNSLRKFVADETESNPGNRLSLKDFQVLFCQDKSRYCHLSWATVGQGMVRKSSSELWLSDTLDVFLQLNDLFGKDYKSLTNPFSMFGKFDGKSNVLFHDVTMRLRQVPTARNTDSMPLSYEEIMKTNITCLSSGFKYTINMLLLIITVGFNFILIV